jgi:general secretion pathway protein G
MRTKGFTLIELIVVIAIIAILAAIIAPNAFKAIEKAKISGSVEDFRSIKTAAMAFYSDTGMWPDVCTTTACAAEFITSSSKNGWDGPYLEKWPPQAKWGGGYNWNNAANTAVFLTGGSNAGERYVTVTNVPFAAAVAIDKALDGNVTSGTAGSVRYDMVLGAGPGPINLLVSRDGPTN